MSLSPARYKTKKPTHTFSLEHPDSCEIEIELIVGMDYMFRMKSKDHSYKKRVTVAAESKGQSSIKVLIEALKMIDGLRYKNVSIYYQSAYAVKVYNDIYRLVRSKKVDASPNKKEILELYDLAQTVGVRYYINVKTEKVIKTYTHDKPFND